VRRFGRDESKQEGLLDEAEGFRLRAGRHLEPGVRETIVMPFNTIVSWTSRIGILTLTSHVFPAKIRSFRPYARLEVLGEGPVHRARS